MLLHEMVYLSSKGLHHLTDNVAPVLGIHLGSYSRLCMHAMHVAGNMWMLISPDVWHLPLFCFASLSLLISSFPKRLPNHLIVAWFFLLAFVVDRVGASPVLDTNSLPNSLAYAIIRTLTVLTYCIASFHKCNREYFQPNQSCGVGLLIHYLIQKGIPLKRRPAFATPLGIHFVVAAEVVIPLLLLSGELIPIGIVIGVILHTGFGFLAHVHFSTLMFAGLLSFFPHHSLWDFLPSSSSLALLAGGGLLMGYIFGNFATYKHRNLAMCNHMLFAWIVLLVILSVIHASLLDANAFSQLPMLEITASHLIIAVAYLTNGMAPYLGLKFDFSLAMFSNLRPDHWSHFLIPRPLIKCLPRYVQILQVVELPSNPSDAAMALSLFDQYFPSFGVQHFSIGYALDAIHSISNQAHGGHLAVEVIEIVTKTQIVLSSALHTIELRFCERLSVYPYVLPCGVDTPLCH